MSAVLHHQVKPTGYHFADLDRTHAYIDAYLSRFKADKRRTLLAKYCYAEAFREIQRINTGAPEIAPWYGPNGFDHIPVVIDCQKAAEAVGIDSPMASQVIVNGLNKLTKTDLVNKAMPSFLKGGGAMLVFLNKEFIHWNETNNN